MICYNALLNWLKRWKRYWSWKGLFLPRQVCNLSSGSRPPSDSNSADGRVSNSVTSPSTGRIQRSSELEKRAFSHETTSLSEALVQSKPSGRQRPKTRRSIETHSPNLQEAERYHQPKMNTEGQQIFGDRITGRMLACVIDGMSCGFLKFTLR